MEILTLEVRLGLLCLTINTEASQWLGKPTRIPRLSGLEIRNGFE